MISLAAVETLAAELWPDALSAVASVPDARKGERLVLVTNRKDPVRSDLIQFARSRGASELMVPAEVMVVDKLPLLGSGKIDNMAVTKFVRELFFVVLLPRVDSKPRHNASFRFATRP